MPNGEDMCSQCQRDHKEDESGICEYQHAVLMGRRTICLYTDCPIKERTEVDIMQFMPELQAFLKKNGKIYTVRKFKMDTRLVTIETGESCKRTFLKQITTREELEPYVYASGFNNLLEWWGKIRRHIPPQGPFYLYQVDLVPRKEHHD